MKILNFGSLNIDHVYSVEHIAAPGETISSAALNDFPGGKGLNQSIAAARCGAKIFHAGMIGKDGAMLKKLLSDSGVDTRYVKTCGVPTGNAVIQVDKNGQNSIILFGGANRQISNGFVDEVLENFGARDILLLQNEINNTPYIMKRAHERGMQIYLNPSPITRQLLEYPLELVKCFILNEIEGKELTGESDEESILAALLKKYPGCKVILTLGEKGAIYKDAENEHRQGIYKVKAVDTTGAGDTFTGYFIASVANNRSVPESLRLASMAAAIAVSRPGAAVSIPLLEEVINSNLVLG